MAVVKGKVVEKLDRIHKLLQRFHRLKAEMKEINAELREMGVSRFNENLQLCGCGAGPFNTRQMRLHQTGECRRYATRMK